MMIIDMEGKEIKVGDTVETYDKVFRGKVTEGKWLFRCISKRKPLEIKGSGLAYYGLAVVREDGEYITLDGNWRKV